MITDGVVCCGQGMLSYMHDSVCVRIHRPLVRHQTCGAILELVFVFPLPLQWTPLRTPIHPYSFLFRPRPSYSCLFLLLPSYLKLPAPPPLPPNTLATIMATLHNVENMISCTGTSDHEHNNLCAHTMLRESIAPAHIHASNCVHLFKQVLHKQQQLSHDCKSSPREPAQCTRDMAQCPVQHTVCSLHMTITSTLTAAAHEISLQHV